MGEFVVFQMPDGTEVSNDPRFEYEKQHERMVNTAVPHTGTVSPTNPPAVPAEGGSRAASEAAQYALDHLAPDVTTDPENRRNQQGFRDDEEAVSSEDGEQRPYSEWVKDDLINEASRRGLDTSGRKSDLVSRLEESDEDAGEAEA